MDQQEKLAEAAKILKERKAPEEKITTVKAKDPKRVAAGKRLASISRAANEKVTFEEPPPPSEESWIRLDLLVGIVGVVIAGVTLYFTKRKSSPVSPPAETVVVEPKQPSGLIQFD